MSMYAGFRSGVFLTGLLIAGHALAAGDVSAAGPAKRMLASDDLFRVQEVSDPQVSPDGQWVAYLLGENDRAADEQRSALWMVSWDGKQNVRLTNPSNGIGKPRWSPDGCCLAFLSSSADAEKTRILSLDRRGGEPREILSVTGDIQDYAWSPDGKRLVVAMEQGESEKTPKPIVIDEWHFKQDEGGGYLRAGQVQHLYLLDVGSGHLTPLTSDPSYNESLPTWSPDGSEIAFVRTHGKDRDQDGRADIDVIGAQAGGHMRTLARPYAPQGQHLVWSPDGKRIAYLEGREPRYFAYTQDRLSIISAAGGTPRTLTDRLDRGVASPAFDTPTSLMVAVEDDGTVYPARIDLENGSVSKAATLAPSVVASVTVAAGHVAVLLSNEHAPGEVYALEGGQLRRLTSHNDGWLAEITLGKVEDLRFKSRDGTDIHGQIIKPPNFSPGHRYPTVLWIHGGPSGQDQHSFALDGYDFAQMFAAHGFVVLRVNYRGSSGRGFEFAKAIFADWGHKEVEDLLAGVDHLVREGIADPHKLAIGGWSYGGLLTDYTIASDTRFKVAISGAGSGNQLSMYGSDEYVLQYEHEVGPPWRSASQWMKLSYPFFHADRIRTPTLFVGGEKDFNVPIAGGEQMYQALRSQGVPTQLVVYPGEHHVFTRPSFVKDLAERMVAWVGRYITP